MGERIACLLVGYICGCVLTADIVARKRLGSSAFDVGSHNPGMANIGSLLGVKWAAVVLAGDILKTVLACELARWAIAPSLGQVAVMYGGLGAILGHNYPAWTRFRGGKGVAVTCSMLVLVDPLWGGIALVIGLAVTAISGYLCYGAVVITAAFCVLIAVAYGPGEMLAISVLILALMVIKHGGPCWRALHGLEPKASLFRR